MASAADEFRTIAGAGVVGPAPGRHPAGSSSAAVLHQRRFLHTWDLARATGQDERLDPGKCAQLVDGMLPMDQALRASGH
jgi:hypothetical protein